MFNAALLFRTLCRLPLSSDCELLLTRLGDTTLLEAAIVGAIYEGSGFEAECLVLEALFNREFVVNWIFVSGFLGLEDAIATSFFSAVRFST